MFQSANQQNVPESVESELTTYSQTPLEAWQQRMQDLAEMPDRLQKHEQIGILFSDLQALACDEAQKIFQNQDLEGRVGQIGQLRQQISDGLTLLKLAQNKVQLDPSQAIPASIQTNRASIERDLVAWDEATKSGDRPFVERLYLDQTRRLDALLSRLENFRISQGSAGMRSSADWSGNSELGSLLRSTNNVNTWLESAVGVWNDYNPDRALPDYQRN